MHVVGIDQSEWQENDVHTIDLWYSHRRQRWFVERLNHKGESVGHVHSCQTIEDAEACVAHWLRAHDEAHLMAAWQAPDAADQASTAENAAPRPAHSRSLPTEGPRRAA